ncbi:hypothetical protein CS542_01100 [Pedobacter sp. IW39]|nr:hypothetical protein CS542_01100 [Pedobacter sp. IW39]
MDGETYRRAEGDRIRSYPVQTLFPVAEARVKVGLKFARRKPDISQEPEFNPESLAQIGFW